MLQMFRLCCAALYVILYFGTLFPTDAAPIILQNISHHKGAPLASFTLSNVPGSIKTGVRNEFVSDVVRAPRVMVYYEDLHDEAKYCPDKGLSANLFRPDFKGQSVQCLTSASRDPNKGSTLTAEKRNKIKYLISHLVSMLNAETRVYAITGATAPIKMESHSICKNFKIPESHKKNGLQNVDIALYVASGPHSASSNVPAWAHLCPTGINQPIIVVINVNPEYVLQSRETPVIKAVQEVLNLPSCTGGGKVVLQRNKASGALSKNLVRVNVNCKETDSAKKIVTYCSNNKWSNCTTEGKQCLSFNDLCSNVLKSTVVRTVHPKVVVGNDASPPTIIIPKKQGSVITKSTTVLSFPLVREPRIGSYYEDLYDETKYCPDNGLSANLFRPDFKGQSVQCLTSASRDPNKGSTLTAEKRNKTVKYLIPQLVSMLNAETRVYAITGATAPIKMESHSICKNFKIPESHKKNGLQNVDIALYVASGPHSASSNVPAWAHLCPTGMNQPIIVVINVNPEYVLQSGENPVIKAVQEVLSLPSCTGGGKVVLQRNKASGALNKNLVRVKVNCKETDATKKIVTYCSNNKWSNCTTEGKQCPTFDDMCLYGVRKNVPTTHNVPKVTSTTQTGTSSPPVSTSEQQVGTAHSHRTSEHAKPEEDRANDKVTEEDIAVNSKSNNSTQSQDRGETLNSTTTEPVMPQPTTSSLPAEPKSSLPNVPSDKELMPNKEKKVHVDVSSTTETATHQTESTNNQTGSENSSTGMNAGQTPVNIAPTNDTGSPKGIEEHVTHGAVEPAAGGGNRGNAKSDEHDSSKDAFEKSQKGESLGDEMNDSEKNAHEKGTRRLRSDGCNVSIYACCIPLFAMILSALIIC